MILYSTVNKDLEVWYLDLAGQRARPPLAPTVYALVSYEGDQPSYYVGSSKRFTARLSAHVSHTRSVKLRGHSTGDRLWGPVVAQRRRALVLLLETCPGADNGRLVRREQAWMIAAQRDNGAAALPLQVPATTAPTHGPHAPATLAARRPWPVAWMAALAGFFGEPRGPGHPTRGGRRSPRARPASGAAAAE